MEYLKKAGRRDVMDVLSHCADLKSVYRGHRKGYTNDRDKSMRHIATVPMWVLQDPEWGKYFDNTHNSIDLKKDVEKFLQKTDWLRYDKL